MSCLLLDLGNSRMKWAFTGLGGLRERSARPYPRGADRAQAVIGQVRALAPGSVLACSVLDPELERALVGALDVPVRFVRSEEAEAFGIRLGYDDPHTLGVDRAVGLVGAWARVGGPCILVDCGTAVTIDALDAQGRHPGGVILPGPETMRAGLGIATHGARGVWEGALGRVPVFGRDTDAAVRAGVYRAVVAGIEAVVDEMRAALGSAVTLLASGGDAAWLARQSRLKMQVVPELVLEGLAVMRGP